MVSSRPVLLSVLRSHVSSWLDGGSSPVILASTLALASACTKSAEESVDLLQECWLNGSFATFDHIYAQYLFSDAIVLSMSTLLDRVDISSADQKGRLETACEILCELSNSGHLAAVEFHRQIEAIKGASCALISRRQSLEGSVPLWKQVDEGAMPSGSSTVVASALSEEIPQQDMESELNLGLQYMDDMFSQDISQGLYWPSFD